MVKVFSSFDTKMDEKLIEKAQGIYGADKVCFVRRDPIYLVVKIITPVSTRLIFVAGLLLLAYATNAGPALGEVLERFIWILIAVSGIRIASYSVDKFIDYYMDFTIITPKKITMYDQTGIFNRYTRALDISKIKSISVDKKGVARSVFNFGSIVFFSEGDAAMGDIRLNYISNPYRIEKKIAEVMHVTTEEEKEMQNNEDSSL